jgi:hypothetical protein
MPTSKHAYIKVQLLELGTTRVPSEEGGGVKYEIDLPFTGSKSERTTILTSMLASARTRLAEMSAGLPENLAAEMISRSKLGTAAELVDWMKRSTGILIDCPTNDTAPRAFSAI